MKIFYKLSIIILVTSIIIPLTYAQEMNKTVEQKLVYESQNYLNTTKKPFLMRYLESSEAYEIRFDGEKNVISTFFDPVTLELIGFLDWNLQGDKNEIYNQKQVQEISEEFFNVEVPQKYKSEFSLKEVRKSDSGFYEIEWERKINNISVKNEGLNMWIDYSNGNIISWFLRLSKSTSEINTTPKLNSQEVVDIVLNSYDGEVIKGPYLEIHKNDLLWMINLRLNKIENNIYLGKPQLWLGLSAETGETKIFNPSSGSNIDQVPTLIRLSSSNEKSFEIIDRTCYPLSTSDEKCEGNHAEQLSSGKIKIRYCQPIGGCPDPNISIRLDGNQIIIIDDSPLIDGIGEQRLEIITESLPKEDYIIKIYGSWIVGTGLAHTIEVQTSSKLWYQPILLHPEYVVFTILVATGVFIYLSKTRRLPLIKS